MSIKGILFLSVIFHLLVLNSELGFSPQDMMKRKKIEVIKLQLQKPEDHFMKNRAQVKSSKKNESKSKLNFSDLAFHTDKISNDSSL